MTVCAGLCRTAHLGLTTLSDKSSCLRAAFATDRQAAQLDDAQTTTISNRYYSERKAVAELGNLRLSFI